MDHFAWTKLFDLLPCYGAALAVRWCSIRVYPTTLSTMYMHGHIVYSSLGRESSITHLFLLQPPNDRNVADADYRFGGRYLA